MPTVYHELESRPADYQLSPNSCWWACIKLLWNRYFGRLHGGWWTYPWEVNPAMRPVDGTERRMPLESRVQHVEQCLRTGQPVDPSYWFLYGVPPEPGHVMRLCGLLDGRFGSFPRRRIEPSQLMHWLRTFGPMVVVSRTPTRVAGQLAPRINCHAVIVHGLTYEDGSSTRDAMIAVWNPDRHGAVGSDPTILARGPNDTVPYEAVEHWASASRHPLMLIHSRIEGAESQFQIRGEWPV